MIYNHIIKSIENKKKLFGLLIDPDNHSDQSLINIIDKANSAKVDLILIGGSLLNNHIDHAADLIRRNTKIPMVLFPGSPLQITSNADGILLLSLISGRNPDLLIGNHVIASAYIKRSGLEVLPTGYILIEGGKSTSVEYMSNTRPIPAEKIDIAIATAMAGEMLGLKLIYLEAGSGANNPVTYDLISGVKKNISIPLIVGGGIKTKEAVEKTIKAGADIIVVGTAIEQNSEVLQEMVEKTHSY
ncbi:MAG: geranylgeranylglyceryl/heptaprenylglyceryl phosphate synthase [Bacteroidetes bacterium GWF2_33_16]|nr:MAG: geranylgeranylglyceryl/heptaprenylglyceryl phosphate synthase [Bacteroidetes bacterium GWE2_32_14]OFY08869.1 MAG: geranylgeranylglyceryl/heptaprenylglyceryl phosphate synthase [Bacteroidetes bacterium GWF2_33_16]